MSSLAFKILIAPPLLWPNKLILFISISLAKSSLWIIQLIIKFKSSSSIEKLLFPKDSRSLKLQGSYKKNHNEKIDYEISSGHLLLQILLFPHVLQLV